MEKTKSKIITLGESSVGKTSILQKIKKNIFSNNLNSSTFGIDTLDTNIDFNQQNIHLVFWDTTGQEKFISSNKLYSRSADIIFWFLT